MTDRTEGIGLDTRVATDPRMVLRVEDDEGAFLFDPDTGDLSVLNPTALAVWMAIDGRRSVAEIVTALGQEYEGMGEEAAGQVLDTVRTLAAKGAVTPADR